MKSNKTSVKFTKEEKDAFIKQCQVAFKENIESITKADDTSTGTFKVIVSTEDRDRQGEVVSMDGWDLSFYKTNPVVLWAHDYSGQPIAVCTEIGPEVVNGKNCLVASGKFAPTDEGQQLRKLYEGGFLTTTSVGFIPKEFDQETGTITKQELLEFSFVPVPANPFAVSLSMVKELGLNLEMMQKKGMTFNITADTKADEKDDDEESEDSSDQIGDSCELDDGTPGILAEDPKNPNGALVCVPVEDKSAEGENDGDNDADDDNPNEIDPGDDPYSLVPEIKKLTKSLVAEHDRHTKTVRGHTDDLEEKLYALKSKKDGTDPVEDAMDSYRTKIAAEHEKHMKCMKSIVKDHAEALAKAITESKGMKSIISKSGAKLSKDTKEKLGAIHKAITEATGSLKEMIEGTGGEDNADGSDVDKKPEEGDKSAEELKGSLKTGSKNEIIDDMGEFLRGRAMARSILEVVTRTVQDYNVRAKKNAQVKK